MQRVRGRFGSPWHHAFVSRSKSEHESGRIRLSEFFQARFSTTCVLQHLGIVCSNEGLVRCDDTDSAGSQPGLNWHS